MFHSRASTSIADNARPNQNTEQLAKWLNAKHYVSKYKPIPIEEFWAFDSSIYPASTSRDFLDIMEQSKGNHTGNLPANELIDKFKSRFTPSGSISIPKSKELQNPVTNLVVSLAVETAKAGCGALVFCSNRKGCERLATLVSRAMPRGDNVPAQTLENRKDVLAELWSLPIGIEETLRRTVMSGVAFHRMSKPALCSKTS